MIFLRNDDKNQQEKQTSRVSTYTKEQNTIKMLLITFIFLIIAVMGTANAQANSGETNLQLELITTSNRLVNDESATQQTNLALGSQVGLRVSGDTDSYIYIYNFNSVGDFILLTDSNYNFLPAGQVRTYPNNNSLYEVAGPVGHQSVFVIASHQPLSSARLEELQTQHLRIMLGGARQTEVQDGWLADSIIFNVVNTNYSNSQTGQTPLVNSVLSTVAAANVTGSW